MPWHVIALGPAAALLGNVLKPTAALYYAFRPAAALLGSTF